MTADLRVRTALGLALLLVAQPGAVTDAALVAMAVLVGLLVASVRWRVDAVAIVALFLVGVGLRLAMSDRIGSDVLDVVEAAVRRALSGSDPYGVGYDVSRPPGAPYAYGPLGLLWYVPFLGFPRLAELLAGTAILGVLAMRRRFLGLAVYATAPVLVEATVDGANDTSAGLLILVALAVAARRPVAGAVLLAVAAALKPYALAWAPPLLWWAGLPALGAFLVTSLVAWSPVLFVWGPGSFLRSVQLAGEIHHAPYYSLGAIWEGVTGRPAPAALLDSVRLALGTLTAAAGLRFAASLDRVIVLGALTFVVTLYAGYWSTFAYLAALAPIVCWRIDDWLGSWDGIAAGPVAASAYGRTSTNPAAAKSPSKASASVMRSRRITSKLVASTKE